MSNKIHGIELVGGSTIEKLRVEELATDPAPTQRSRTWFNTTERALKFTRETAPGVLENVAFAVVGANGLVTDQAGNTLSGDVEVLATDPSGVPSKLGLLVLNSVDKRLFYSAGNTADDWVELVTDGDLASMASAIIATQNEVLQLHQRQLAHEQDTNAHGELFVKNQDGRSPVFLNTANQDLVAGGNTLPVATITVTSADPAGAPSKAGVFVLNATDGRLFFSKGTTNEEDWVDIVIDRDLAAMTTALVSLQSSVVTLYNNYNALGQEIDARVETLAGHEPVFARLDANNNPVALVIRSGLQVESSSSIYVGKPSGGNDTAHIASCIAAASLAGSGLRTGVYVRVVFEPGAIYSADYVNPLSNVWLDFQGCEIRKPRAAFDIPSNAMCRTIDELQPGNTYYGKYRNIRISDVTFNKNGFYCPAHCVRLTSIEDLVLDNVSVIHTPTESTGSWAFCLAGRRIRAINCSSRISTGNIADAILYQDGMHVGWGQDIQIIGGHFQAGDDPLVYGIDGDGSATDKWDDEPLTRVVAIGCTVESSRGAVKAYRGININGGTFRGQIIGARMIGITGRCGILRNGGVSILDTRATGQNANDLRDIRIDATLDVGSIAHDGNNPIGAFINYATDCKIDLAARIVDTTGAATRFRFGTIRNSVRCDVIPVCDALPALGGVLIENSDSCGVVGGEKRGVLRGGTGNPVVVINSPNTVVADLDVLNMGASAIGVFVSTGVSSVRLRGCRFTEAAANNGSRIFASGSAANCSHVEISGNDCSGMATSLNGNFNTTATAYDISNNQGLVTTRGGIATIGAAATTVTVTHNANVRLVDATEASLPQVSVTPVTSLGSAARYWVSPSADTAFVINVDVAPGGSGARFAWSVNTGKKPVA